MLLPRLNKYHCCTVKGFKKHSCELLGAGTKMFLLYHKYKCRTFEKKKILSFWSIENYFVLKFYYEICLGTGLALVLDWFVFNIFLNQNLNGEAVRGCGDQALFFPPCLTTGLVSNILCSLGTWDEMIVTSCGFLGLSDRLDVWCRKFEPTSCLIGNFTAVWGTSNIWQITVYI